MRKLLLLLFLCSLTSNALAKVEIWKCGPDNNGVTVYMKLHTEPAKIYYRVAGQWRDIARGDIAVAYSEEQDAIYQYKNFIISSAYDFVTKEVMEIDPENGSSKGGFSCKVIE